MKILSVSDVANIISKHGFNNLIIDLVKQLKSDFARWHEFDKTPRHALHVDGGVIELMPVCDKQYYTFKYVNGHPKNPISNKQTVVATGQLSRISDGYPIMSSEMTTLTALRTAATAILATDLLARKDSKTLAIIGTGAQSEFQTLAHLLIRDIKTIKFYDTDPHAMVKYHNNMINCGAKLIACDSAKDAVINSDIVIVCTACKGHVDVIKNDWVNSGMHINGLGGDCPGKTELELSILFRSKIVVEYTEQSLIEGEIQRLTKEDSDRLVHAELWEIISGNKIGRESEDEITLFDSVGFAIEDYSVLRLIYELAHKYEIGHQIELIPDLVDPKNLYSVLSNSESKKKIIYNRQINLLGASMGACAGILGCEDAPKFLDNEIYKKIGLKFSTTLEYLGAKNDIKSLQQYFISLSQLVYNIALGKSSFPVIIGGDHSIAIGTWSGFAHAMSEINQAFGLIWIDAHMDSHTPITTISGNIHGMPVATLLGKGYAEFTSIFSDNPKILSENIVLIGIRSYEDAELEFLNSLGIRIYYADDVNNYGIDTILNKAYNELKSRVDKVGFSIDLDGFSPDDTPAVGTPVDNGIKFDDFIKAFAGLDFDYIAGLEIAEFNPKLDKNSKTLENVIRLLAVIQHKLNNFVKYPQGCDVVNL